MLRSTFFFSIIVIPLLEILIFNFFSSFLTLNIIVISQVISASVGIYILRPLDLNLPFHLEAELQKGEPIVRELWEESIKVIGGVLLVIPGLLTDLLGIIIVTPYFRIKLMSLISNKL